jgi:hypothetical protein
VPIALAFAAAAVFAGTLVGQLLDWQPGASKTRIAVLLTTTLAVAAGYVWFAALRLSGVMRNPAGFPLGWPQPDWLLAWLGSWSEPSGSPGAAKQTIDWYSVEFALRRVLLALLLTIGGVVGLLLSRRRFVPASWNRRFPGLLRVARATVWLAFAAGAVWALYELHGVRIRWSFLDKHEGSLRVTRRYLPNSSIEVDIVFDLRERDIIALSWFPEKMHLTVRDASVPTACRLSHKLDNLCRLDLFGSTITADDLRQLRLCSGLVTLALCYNRLDSHALAELHHTGIEALSLAGSSVTDSAVAVVSRIPNLQWLQLDSDLVTAAGLRSLANAPHLRKLLFKSKKVTRDDLEAFRRKRPDVVLDLL